jgi:acyl-coenzyme A synthetase/AMP-(fatty) acid ligase
LIDEKMGEVVQIYLVVDKNSKKEINELRSEIDKLISNKLPVYMRPMKYTFLKSFPKTTTGKIKKKSLGKIESEALC